MQESNPANSVKCFRCVFIRCAYSRTLDHNEVIKMQLTRRSGPIKTRPPQNIDIKIVISDARLVAPYEDTGGPIQRLMNIYVQSVKID